MTTPEEPGDAYDVTIRIIRKPGMIRDEVMSHITRSVRQWETTNLTVTAVTMDPEEAALIAELNRLLRGEM